jgi:hypothetical protein
MRDQGGSQTNELLSTSAPTKTVLAVVIASSPTLSPAATLTAIPVLATQSPRLPPTLVPATLVLIPVESSPIALLPTAVSKQYALLISRHADQSLFIINIGLDPFPLNGLRIGNDHGVVVGAQWQVSPLDNGACVSLWQADGNLAASDVVCTEVGGRITRNKPDVFWTSAFTVYYNEVSVATCDQDTCLVRISVR